MKISIVIRTLNEEKYLGFCLQEIEAQILDDEVEIIVVDSGSTDKTLEIAKSYNANIVFIEKKDFSFGRSLNLGCETSLGDIVVFISGHCIPTSSSWLKNLIDPLKNGLAEYSYGRQISREGVSKYSEGRVFAKYYPELSALPQEGYFCNNANSALIRKTWEHFKFDEKLTGLEDMALAKEIVLRGGKVAYVATSVVEHVHEETWRQIMLRFERESFALEYIQPGLSLTILQAIALFFIYSFNDIVSLRFKGFLAFREILLYRFCQFYGTIKGMKIGKYHRNIMKREYFYPTDTKATIRMGEKIENGSTYSNEGA